MSVRATVRRPQQAQPKVQPIVATSVTFASCPHGRVFIHFHDANGVIFAVAAMDLAVALEASAAYDEAIEGVMKGRGPTPTVMN